MKTLLSFVLMCFSFTFFAQQHEFPCAYEAMLNRTKAYNTDAIAAYADTETQLQKIITQLRTQPQTRTTGPYIIPVVMHVFHDGENGKMDMEQALSGLDILNNDFNGLNDGWNTIDDTFDPIKSTLDITFCLATIDPQGNPTTGINYYDDENAMLNQGDLFQYAWDNYKYLNIYFPKYTGGEPSDFTAYAYFPNTTNTEFNIDGIFYSSIRWGYGNHSELEEGDDWASVCTHEAGHWLDLRHTFNGGCNNGQGDLIADTPPTQGSGIELAGCNNNDYSCGVQTNGSNFMDYNHRCKKMFTIGQVERMTAALQLPSRINLWSEENLIETGCKSVSSTSHELKKDIVKVYPNPAKGIIVFELKETDAQLKLFNLQGQVLNNYPLSAYKNEIAIDHLKAGIYFYSIATLNETKTGKIIVL